MGFFFREPEERWEGLTGREKLKPGSNPLVRMNDAE